jgi:hypothetical protein
MMMLMIMMVMMTIRVAMMMMMITQEHLDIMSDVTDPAIII